MTLDHLQRFERELKQPHPQPERLALAIAGIAYPTLQADDYLFLLDEMAEQVRDALTPDLHGRRLAEEFMLAVNAHLGLHGNQQGYYDPRNSYLNDVLERRTGLPILLSVVCMALGRRLGLAIEGAAYPGHFMARLRDDGEVWLLDPFYGRVSPAHGVSDYLSELFGRHVQLAPQIYGSLPPAFVAQRMLNNLRGIFLEQKDYDMARQVLDHMLVMMPTTANLWQERGVLYYHLDQWEEAARDLHRYFFLSGTLADLMDNRNNEQVVGEFSAYDRTLVSLYWTIEKLRDRIN
jgi:regulator of sirC expression with transglutaminase-like and TPR domain